MLWYAKLRWQGHEGHAGQDGLHEKLFKCLTDHCLIAVWHAGQDALHDKVFECLTGSLLDSCVACRTR